ncbi:rhotekin-2 isoform 2-T2 [Pangshura tecta]
MQRCRGPWATCPEPECSIQEKIDFEIRMREGICKLLAVSTQKDQVLHAVKNLMVCNARVLAYKTELQKQKEEPDTYRTGGGCSDVRTKERAACRGKVAISDIRIPLMWKDSDHFSSKERSQRYAIFCLFKMGAEVFDTDMVIVDKTITDICFENVTIFDEARPDFQVKFEVYSCCTDQSSTITNTPKKLAKKLKTSIGKATGKKINSFQEEDNLESFSFTDPIIPGAKYSLLAHTTLGLDSAEDNFRTHNLTVTGNEESSFWLPLYGSMCCRLVAQPFCMAKDVMSGFLNQQMVGSLTNWRRLYCVLRGGKLFCYYTPEEIEAKVEPALTVSINKETRIRAVDRGTEKRINNFTVTNPVDGEAVTQLFAADSREELHKWMEAFWQHFYDLSQWKHCCEEFMKIEIMSPRKPPLFLTKEATSVYHDMSIDSPVKHEGLTDIIQRKIEETDGEFLIGQQKESVPSVWAPLFDGSHQMLVQKNIVFPDANSEVVSPNDGKGKKRRAPLPPSDKLPYSSKTQMSTDRLNKENLWKKSTIARRTSSSFDAKLSSMMHQLQRPIAAPRKLVPCRKSSSNDSENPLSSVTETESETKPVPAPRQKSIKEILDPRSWLQSQV